MILNRLKNYYSSLYREFHVLLAGLMVKGGEKNLHALRVNVKKHLAFFNLMPFLDPNFPLKMLRKPFRNCMKQTGQLRDIEVGLGIVKQQENEISLDAAYSKHLQEEHQYYLALLKQFEEVFSILRVREVSETVKVRLDLLAGRAGLWAGLNNYFLSQLDLVRQSVQVVILSKKDKPLHVLRMNVKELMLNLELLQSLAPQKVKLKKLHIQLDHLQDLLGEWHDRFTSLARMRQEKKRIPKKLKAALKREKTAYFDRILFYLNSFTLLHLWALNIFHDLFSHPPIEKPMPKRTVRVPKPKTSVKSSFPQLNIGEGQR